MPAHIVTHICYIFMVAVSPIFFMNARTAHRQENPPLRRFYLLYTASYLLLGTGGILSWLQFHQRAIADAGDILEVNPSVHTTG